MKAMPLLTLWLLLGHLQTLQVKPNSYVIVMDCKTMALTTLYTDEKMVIVKPNPLIADAGGLVQFTVGKSGCYKVAMESK